MKSILNQFFTVLLFMLIIMQSKAQNVGPGPWLYDQNENKVDDRIEALINTHPDSLIGIIVDLSHPPGNEDVMWLRMFGRVYYIMQYIPSVCIRDVVAHRIFEIAEQQHVVMVELEGSGSGELDVSVCAIKAKQSTTYQQTAWQKGYKGKGINIAILDSGVDDGHPSLDDMDDKTATTDPKYIAGYNTLVNPRVEMNPDDDWVPPFHGTAMAGTALGTGGGTAYAGVAPEAKLIDVKVLNSSGRYQDADLIAGIEWCINNRKTAWPTQSSDYKGIDILNMSVGSDDCSNGQDAVCRITNKAADFGLIAVGAVGNKNKYKISCVKAPAAADNAIAVSSVDDKSTVNRSDDVYASDSNYGPRTSDVDYDWIDEYKPDVSAYGVKIHVPAGIHPGQKGTGYNDLGGTSLSTAHVSGVCALILQSHPYFMPHDVKNLLRATAEARGIPYNVSNDPKYNVSYGCGIVDAYKAVTTTKAPIDLWICRKPVWWLSDSIWTASKPEINKPNTIYARINNTSGTAPSLPVSVSFQVGRTGIGQYKWLWKSTKVVTVPAIGSVVASTSWTPTASQLQNGSGHPCIRVTIHHSPDPNTANNIAQKNLTIEQGSGTGQCSFTAWNPFDGRKKIFFGLDKSRLPEGWDASLSHPGVYDMNYADSLNINVEIQPGPFAMPGDLGTVYVTGYMKGSVEAYGGVAFTMVVVSPPAPVYKSSQAPIIDGVFDGLWKFASENKNFKIQAGEGKWKDPKDASFNFRMLEDDQYLYFYFTVKDETRISDSGVEHWEDDCIELWIDGDNSKGINYDGRDDRGFYFSVDPADPFNPVRRVAQSCGPAVDLSGVLQASRRTASGFSLEVAFPLSILGIVPAGSSLFGLEVDYNDDDDGEDRDTKLKYFSDLDDSWKNPSTLGTARLIGVPSDLEQHRISANKFLLSLNYSNPLNSFMDVTYSIPKIDHVTLKVYDANNREIAVLVNEIQTAGLHNVQFDMSDLPKGIYFFCIETEEKVQSKTLMIHK